MPTKNHKKSRTFKSFLEKLPPGWEPKDYIIHILNRHKYSLKKAAPDLGYTHESAISLLCAAYEVPVGQHVYYNSSVPAIAELLKQGRSLDSIAAMINMGPRALSTMLRKHDIWTDRTPIVFYGCPPRALMLYQMLSLLGIPKGVARYHAKATGITIEQFLYEEFTSRGRTVSILYPAGYPTSLVSQLLTGETS